MPLRKPRALLCDIMCMCMHEFSVWLAALICQSISQGKLANYRLDNADELDEVEQL